MNVIKTFGAGVSFLAFGVLAAQAQGNLCINDAGQLLVGPADSNYCSCLSSLNESQRDRLNISEAQADRCLTTGSINRSETDINSPPDDGNGPPDDGNGPPDDSGAVGDKGNNG